MMTDTTTTPRKRKPVTVQDLIDLCELRELDPSTTVISHDAGTQMLRSFKKVSAHLVEHVTTKEISTTITLA